MHPYECNSQTCIHCRREFDGNHDPDLCMLCNFDDDEERGELRARLRDALDEIAALRGSK